MDVKVASHVIEQMFAHSRDADPQECCGILLGDGKRIERAVLAQNVHPSPQTHFEIDPQALIDAHRGAREGGAQVVGYYHSHPVGKAEPSKTDAAMASGDGRIWAIVAEETVRFWQDQPDGFAAVSYEVLER